MTEASSCKKSYFGKYLRYRIGRMKAFLLVGSILNFVVLPLSGLAMFLRVNRLYNISIPGASVSMNFTVMVYMTLIGAFAGIIGLAFTMVCAASSYNYFIKKESVDTLGVLAVTYNQRFWGDFLSGIIPCMGTFIPCALIGVIFTSIAQNKLDKFTIDDKHIDIMPFFMGLTLTLFFANLFIYLLTTLAAMCCGRSSSMIIFSVISFAAIPVLGISFSKFITQEAVGMDDTLVAKVQQLCMPAGLFFSPALTAMEIMIDEHNQKLIMDLSELDFAVNSSISIVILSVAALVILALAYFAGKSRKQENVGRMFVKPVYFHIITIMMSLGGFFIVAGALRNSNRGLIIPIGLGVSLVIAVIFEIIRRPRARQLPKSAARWVVSATCGVGLMFLISGTGAFGMINIPKNVKSVSVEFSDENNIHYNIELTDPVEISEFVDSHNKNAYQSRELLERPADNYFMSSFIVRYTTSDNKQEVRAYKPNIDTSDYSDYEKYTATASSLSNNVMSLSFYPKKSAEILDGRLSSAIATIPDIFTNVKIPADKLDEFAQALKQDILEYHDPNAESVGSVSVNTEDSAREYSIQSDYENILRLIRGYNNSAEKDPDAEVMYISFSKRKKMKTSSGVEYWGNTSGIGLNICERDMENPKVKELLELIKPNLNDYSESEIEFYIRASNEVNYNISDADKNHVALLIAQIAAESVK